MTDLLAYALPLAFGLLALLFAAAVDRSLPGAAGNDAHVTSEDCIHDYPQYRNELKPLVEAAIRLKQGADH